MCEYTGSSGADADQTHQLRDCRLPAVLEFSLASHFDLTDLFLDKRQPCEFALDLRAQLLPELLSVPRPPGKLKCSLNMQVNQWP